MVALVIGQMHFQQMKVLINVRHQTQVLHHQVHRSDSTTVHCRRSPCHLIVNVTSIEHRSRLVFPVLGFQSTFDSLLAVPKDFGIVSIHSKWPFVGCYSGQVSRTWNWSDGTRDRITLNAAGTVRVRPHQVTTTDGQTFLSYAADLDTTNHVWGTAIEDGSVPTYVLNFDATRIVSRSLSSTYSHFTPQTASYLYFETEDSVYAPPDDITVYAWEYVSSQQVLRLWVALSDPFYYPDDSYEHYDFPATQVVTGQSSAHSCLLVTAVDSQGAPVPGAQVVFGGL